MPRTATTAHALLGLLSLRRELTTWELNGQLQRTLRFFWPRAESRILAELRRLDGDGLVRSRRETVGRRERTVYSITAAGRRRVASWLETEPRGSALESEPLLRIMLGDLAPPERMLAAIAKVEEDAHAILATARAVAAEYEAGTAPFQDHVHVRRFVFDYLTTHATAMLGWAGRARAALDDWPSQSSDERAAAAVGAIAAMARALPPERPQTPGP